jgi:uracil-DNA glycosylase family 4
LTGETSSSRAGARPRDAAEPSAIEDAYLRRAIAEMGALADEIATADPRPDGTLPVMSSGSPQAEIALVKWEPSRAEQQEGVAFFGRAGAAVLKSVQRLEIDPLRLFGTLVLRRESPAGTAAGPRERSWLRRELMIVEPKIVVAMGHEVLEVVNALDYPLSEPLRERLGEVQRWTPTIDALLVPDIDRSLDEDPKKREFWTAFRALGEWHREQPPY